jgi:hypothetical protein
VRRSEAAVVASTIAIIVISTLEVGRRTCHRCDSGDEGDAFEGDIVAQNRFIDFRFVRVPKYHSAIKAAAESELFVTEAVAMEQTLSEMESLSPSLPFLRTRLGVRWW